MQAFLITISKRNGMDKQKAIGSNCGFIVDVLPVECWRQGLYALFLKRCKIVAGAS